MSSSLSPPVLLTKSQFLSLAYHDIFDYPLSEEQIDRWQMVSGKRGEYEAEKTGSYYHLPGRADTVMIRRYREKLSRKKFGKAKLLASLLGRIPTIKFIGLSGSLAMKNAIRESDIDFLVITQARTLWVTRALVHLFLLLSGRARWGSGQDSLCLNMWLDEENLLLEKKRRNIYSAHEVLQVVPLVDKGNTFQKFVKQNRWVEEYWRSSSKFIRRPADQISNFERKKKFNPPSQKTTDVSPRMNANRFQLRRDSAPDEARGEDTPSASSRELHVPNLIFCLTARALEQFAYHLQLWYMRRRRSCETVERGRAFFHPFNWNELVLREFSNRKIKYEKNLKSLYLNAAS